MRLSTHDASFLYTETASGPMHSVGLITLDGIVSYAELLEYYRARIHLVPRFRQKLAFVPFNMAHPKWIDDPDFQLENHIKPHDLPAGTSMAQAIEIALELGEPLLERDRPLWLTYVLSDIEGQTLIAQITHHAFVDGATAIAITTVLTDTAPDAPAPPSPSDAWNPPAEPAQAELMQEALAEQAQAFTTSLTAGFGSNPFDAGFVQKSTALMNRMARPVMQAPWNAGPVGPKRKFTTLPMTLADFKPIRGAFGGTMNDVAVAVIVEAAARYMKSKGEITNNQSLRLMCPVNVREKDSNPLDMEGNKVSGMFPILDAGSKSMTARYEEVREELQGIKDRGEAETMNRLQETQPNVPPAFMAPSLAIGTAFDPTALAARNPQPVTPVIGARPQQFGFNFTLTNVPGPTWTQYIAGHEVTSLLGTLMLGGNLGLGVGVGSYNGQMVFGFTADPRLMPDLQQFRNLAADCFAELTEAALEAAADSA